jgi:hypothetical protein
MSNWSSEAVNQRRDNIITKGKNDKTSLLPALGIVPKYLLNERVVMRTKIQTPIPHPVLNESYVL